VNSVVLGAGGGLGRNAVEAALAAGHAVRALVRDPAKAALPPAVEVVRGDARSVDDLQAALRGVDVAFFCVNPAWSRWVEEFPPLLEAAIEGCLATGARLVFPANVWIFGPGRRGEAVGEGRPASPTSVRGGLRARMEERIARSGVRHRLVRLPEFYGPHVVTLTARLFRAALTGSRALWPGPLDAELEFVFMPDGARALVEAGAAPGGDAETFHVPGIRTTPRAFIEAIFAAAGARPRATSVPGIVMRLAGLFDAGVRGAADVAHLWTDPILLDGSKFAARFGRVPQTAYAEGIARTLEWHKANPGLTLQS